MKTDTMGAKKADTMGALPEDVIFFAPLEDINIINNVIRNLEITQRELRKVIEGMKPVEN